MKPIPRIRLAIALALPLATSHAQEAPPLPPMPTSEVLTVVRAAMKELNAADDPALPVPARVERSAAHRYSEKTAAGLVKIFGSEHPETIERLPGAAGGTDYRIGLPALRYTDDKGILTEWEALRAEVKVDKSGRGVETHGSWPSISSGNDELRFGMHGLSYDNKVRFDRDGLWFGTVRMHADSAEAGSDKQGYKVRFEDLRVDGRVVEKPKTIDQIVSLDIKAIRFGDQSIDDFRLAMRFLNFDKAASAQMVKEANKLNTPDDKATPAQQMEALKPLLRAMGKAALAKGAVMQLDELGMRYGGHRASLKGQLRIANGTPADLDDAGRLLKKLVARIEIRVPVALVREVAGAVAAKQAAAQAAQHGGTADAQTIAQLRQSITDVIIGKLVGGGFARLDNEVLVSTLEWKDGKLTANGKPVPLPSPPRNATPALASAPGRGNILQARLVDGSCTLPGFPDEVTRADRALRQRIEFTIGADGRVKDTHVTQPSGFPDYDGAMAAALAQCVYVPALRDGKPIELRSSRETVRSAGAGAGAGAAAGAAAGTAQH